MRRLLYVAVLGACVNGAALGESKGGAWLRRLTLAASCASSFWDLHTTRTAVSYGAREANPLFASRSGDPRWRRMVGVKVGLCAGMAAGQELLDRNRRSRRADWAWSGVNAALAVRHSAAALHNARVADQMRRQPEYLLQPR